MDRWFRTWGVVIPEFFHLCISSPKFGACLPCPALCMALQLQVDKVDSPLHLVSLTNRKPLSGERSQLLQSNVIEWRGLLVPHKKCNYSGFQMCLLGTSEIITEIKTSHSQQHANDDAGVKIAACHFQTAVRGGGKDYPRRLPSQAHRLALAVFTPQKWRK